MACVKRMTVSKHFILPASVGALWALAADWGGLMKWVPKGEPGANVIDCKLIGDDESLPLTRVLVLDSGIEIMETLVLRDDRLRRLRYHVHDGYFPNLINYYGTYTVVMVTRAQLEAMFEHVIHAGLAAYLAGR